MTRGAAILLAGLGSLALLLGALGFQYLGGLAPCPMCIWQRWPHVAAVVIALVALTVLARWQRPFAVAGALAMTVGAGLGVFHAGVEQGWWQGPTKCSGIDPAGLSPDQLLTALTTAPLVRCDEIAWAFLGISMAGWNALFSAALALVWVLAAASRAPSGTVPPAAERR